jgi:hypothetical protein
MPRSSNTKDTPIEFNKMSLQISTRYRESGLVLGSFIAARCILVGVCFQSIGLALPEQQTVAIARGMAVILYLEAAT